MNGRSLARRFLWLLCCGIVVRFGSLLSLKVLQLLLVLDELLRLFPSGLIGLRVAVVVLAAVRVEDRFELAWWQFACLRCQKEGKYKRNGREEVR